MDKIRILIAANSDRYIHFQEYNKIIEIIEKNENTNPDICIESCKALVEGISKTILTSLDSTKNENNIDKDNLPKLFKETINLLAESCEDLEGDFVNGFGRLIHVLGEIRNKRGDISHGRVAPKIVFSSKKFASTVKNMTESMLEYILEHYFELDLSTNTRLDYDSKEMAAYNDWLDENTDFPIKKAKYSKILIENDYDEYESLHNDYLDYIESSKSEEKDEMPNEENVETLENGKQPVSEKEKVVPGFEEETKKPSKVSKEELKLWYDKYFGQVDEPLVVETLVNTFDEGIFWTEARKEQTRVFATGENLKVLELQDLISRFLFTEKPPFRDDVAEVMAIKPPLTTRAKILDELTNKILSLARQLNAPESA